MTAESSRNLSIVHGPTQDALWSLTIGALINNQARTYGERRAVTFPRQKTARTYLDLLIRSKFVAKALVESGLKYGDRVGITAGNCVEYIEVFLGAARIGCPVVVLNSTYIPEELFRAITFTNCKVVCAARYDGLYKDLGEHLSVLTTKSGTKLQLVLFNGTLAAKNNAHVESYGNFLAKGEHSELRDAQLAKLESLVQPGDIVNLQFTSGTTGNPKAAMLSHINLINNGRFVGDRLCLTPLDVVCCPPPLFHCFGLVMGFLGSFTHGSSIVFPAPRFDPDLVLDAIEAEQCTVLYGVPTMFLSELDANKRRQRSLVSLKKGLASGSLVPTALLGRLKEEMGIETVLNAYGMTETSPVTFGTTFGCPQKQLFESVGTVLPHTSAKIIDSEGQVVLRGTRGQICISGYALQQGYLENPEKTNEVMILDADGTLWMHTGDEGVIDQDGYCRVTGRIKDMIIRGGENIVPSEIEDRLLTHPSVVEVCVVGIPDEKYGEVVGCFARQTEQSLRPSLANMADWVRQTLGNHKAPKYVFWIGESEVDDFPKTASGKHQKHILRAVAARLVRQSTVAGVMDIKPRL